MKGLWLVIKLTELKEQWNIKFTINNSRKLKRILIRNSCIEAKEYVIVEWKKWLGKREIYFIKINWINKLKNRTDSWRL